LVLPEEEPDDDELDVAELLEESFDDELDDPDESDESDEPDESPDAEPEPPESPAGIDADFFDARLSVL
jgi:hypothetical protein